MSIHQTHQIEPGDDEDDQAGTDSANAAAIVPADTGEVSPFRKGVEAAGTAVDPEQVADLQPKPAEEAVVTDDGVDEHGEPIVTEQKPPAVKPDDEDERTPEQITADEKFEAELAKDIKALETDGAKPKTIERFKTMSGRIRELETTLTRLPDIEAAAQRAQEWEDTMFATGAKSEQIGAALGYLQTIHHGTPEQQHQALAALDKERAWLAQKLGIKTDTYNPLDEHPDLKKRVEEADLDEADALELIEARRGKAARETQQTTQTVEQQQQAALATIADLGAGWKKADPQFSRKLQYLAPAIEVIQTTMSPDKWAGAIKKAYEKLPALPPVIAPKPRPTVAPVRAGGGGDMKPEITTQNAFRLGVQQAKEQGR